MSFLNSVFQDLPSPFRLPSGFNVQVVLLITYPMLFQLLLLSSQSQLLLSLTTAAIPTTTICGWGAWRGVVVGLSQLLSKIYNWLVVCLSECEKAASFCLHIMASLPNWYCKTGGWSPNTSAADLVTGAERSMWWGEGAGA